MLRGAARGVFLCLLVVALGCGDSSGASSPPDNILIIIVDDLGVDAVGAYAEGAAPPPTPSLDALAARGVLFRNAWANPVCSATRALIMTGRYSFRTGIGAARWQQRSSRATGAPDAVRNSTTGSSRKVLAIGSPAGRSLAQMAAYQAFFRNIRLGPVSVRFGVF